MQPSFRDSRRPYAIIIDLVARQGLLTARILARHDIPVIAITGDPKHYHCRTRVCEEILSANTGNEELISALETLGPQLSQKAVLFPCSDENVLLVSRHRQTLKEWYHVILPAPDVVEMMMDKTRFYTYAQEERFSIPRTLFLRSRTDAEQAAEKLTFPCILKPPRRSREWVQHTYAKSFKVSNAEGLLALYDHCHRWVETLIAQEWIEGPDANLYNVNCYFDANSEPLVTFVFRKLRQWPPQIGDTSLGEECRNDAVLRETVRLLRSVEHRGLGYAEIKRDERSGQYFIVEPSIGRPTGNCAIAEASGVELLYTMYCDAVGRPLPADREQKYEGVKYVHLRKDFQSALHYWRQGELTLREWWQSRRGRKMHVLFSWTDPGPFLGDLLRAIRLFLSSQERKKRLSKPPM